MKNKEGFKMKGLWPIIMYYPGIFQEGLWSITGLWVEIRNQDLLSAKQ
jgi:hypothetical protein